MSQQYNNETLKQEIDALNKKRTQLVHELTKLNSKIFIKTKVYNDCKTLFYFSNGICSSCYCNLTNDDIEDETIFCEECRDNDSVLDYNAKLSEDIKFSEDRLSL
jgi:hypothetical protein